MNTEQLITRLANEAVPVRPLPRPWRRALIWLTLALAYLAASGALAFARRSRLAATSDPLYVLQQAALLITAATAAVAAFVSVVPGSNPRVAFAPLLPGAALIGALAWGCTNDLRLYGTLGLGSATDWPCVFSMTIGGAVLWAASATMLRRGAALTPRLTGLLSGVAALAVANVEACLTRGHPFTSIVVMWHGATTVAALTILAVVSRWAFRWPGATGRERQRFTRQ